MNARSAAKARRIATRQLSYRRWSNNPATADIPAISVITDERLWKRERARQLRRAQVGIFDTIAPVEPTRLQGV